MSGADSLPGSVPWRRALPGMLIALAAVVLAMSLATPVRHAAATLATRLGAGTPAAVQATAFGGTPAVGALFTTTGDGHLGSHFCTASVVDSPHGDLVVTAAHCTSRATVGHVVFVPAYHDGKAPFGRWTVTHVMTDENWARSANPADDVAFLTVSQPGRGPVEQITGAERMGLGLRQVAGRMVWVPGYPGSADAPVGCTNRVHLFSPAQLEFDCGGYTDGTSGSPLLTGVSPATGLGMVIGVIGGYQQGGFTPAVSYAARFGGNVAALYQVAGRF